MSRWRLALASNRRELRQHSSGGNRWEAAIRICLCVLQIAEAMAVLKQIAGAKAERKRRSQV
jgi:hypothetical protein